MSLLVTGSIGIDTVESPSGSVRDVLGGSSVYFAYAASFFCPVRLVGVVGEDCPEGFLAPLEANENIDLTGVEIRPGSKTFRWHGRYHEDVNQRDTVLVELNVLAEAGASIPEPFRDSSHVFLANTHPALQAELLGQLSGASLVVADTMDLYINGERDGLVSLLGSIDALVLNDSEARLLTGRADLIAAGREILSLVRRFVVIKKGEHGSLLLMDSDVRPLPAYPAVAVVDPTGAGDSFAGAMMGRLAGGEKIDADAVHEAAAYGAVVASFCLEDFSLKRLIEIDRDAIEARMAEFRRLATF